MKPHRKVYVLGGDHSVFIGKFHPEFIWKRHPDFGKRENPTLAGHLKTAIEGALESAGISADAIERGFVGNFVGELFINQGHLGALVAGLFPEFARKPFARVEAACASGGLAIIGAVDAIQAGYDVVLACGGEIQTTANARVGADYLARAADYAKERSLDDFTFPCLFARRAKAYKEAHDVTDADIAPVVVKAYEQAAKNPYAHMRTVKMPLEKASAPSDRNPQFLTNPDYKDHLKVSDCSQVSDGGSAAILVSEEGLRKLGKTPADAVELLSYALCASPLGEVEDLLVLDNTEAAAQQAYADAGIGPKDVQVAEVHDCFAITEVLMYEALGFAERGQGWKLGADGATRLDGALPVNTGGGLMAFGHPVGATGIKQVVEICRQIKGLAGDYQMSSRPNVGLTANMGGDDRTTVVTVLRDGASR